MIKRTLTALLIITSLALAGCGGSGGGTPAGATGALEGTVYIPLAAADTQAAAAPLGYKALTAVQVAVGTDSVATDTAGHFLLGGLPTGVASITLTPPAGGYQALTLPVNIVADTTQQLGKISLLSTGSNALALTLNRRDTATAGQVRLYLSVVDAGAPVLGLGGNNFTCQVNGAVAVPTALAQQFNVAAPLSIALVLDRSAGMSGAKLTAMKAAAVDFISKMRAQDEVEIISLGDAAGVKVEKAYSSDKAALTTAINGITAESNTSSFFDAVYQASLDTSLRPAGNNKAVVAITDGGEEGNTHYTTSIALGDYLQTLNVPVYCIGLGIQHDSNRDKALAYQDENDLARIASKSSGEYFYTADSTTLPGTVQRVITRLQQQYIITLPVTGALTGFTVNVTAGTHAGMVTYP